METKTNKVTDMEKLEMLKRQLRSDIKAQEQALDRNLSYLYENMGSIVVGAALNSVREALPAGLRLIASPLLGTRKSAPKEKERESENESENKSKPSGISQLFNDFLPVAAEILLPLALQAGVGFLKKKFQKNK